MFIYYLIKIIIYNAYIDKLIFTTNATTIESEIGETHKISCYINSMDDEIYWWKNGQRIEMVNGISKSLSEPNGTVALIVIVNEENLGTYECRVNFNNSFIANVIEIKRKVLLKRKRRNLLNINDTLHMKAIDFDINPIIDVTKMPDIYESERDLNIICLNKNNKLNPICSKFNRTKTNIADDDHYYRINVALGGSVMLYAVPNSKFIR